MPSAGRGISATVYHDGRFWRAHVEEWDEEGTQAAVHVFGAEPSLPEIAAFINGPEFLRLVFAPLDQDDRPHALAGNPKRRQREAARAARETASVTHSQEAVQAALEERKGERRATARTRRQDEADERRRLRVAKRKQKHRGR